MNVRARHAASKNLKAPRESRSPRFLAWVSELVHKHRNRLIRVARREGLAAEDALDCVQEAFKSFLVLPEARLIGESPEDAAKILTVLTRNQSRNRRRKHHRSRLHVAPETVEGRLQMAGGTPDELVAAAEEHAAALGCLETLGRLQQRVVALRLVDEVDGQDVAQILGTSPGNVSVILHRAMHSLRACMIDAGYRPR